MGLRLGERLRLQVGDIDAYRNWVHVRNAKGNKDRLVPLPDITCRLLCQFWLLDRNPILLWTVAEVSSGLWLCERCE